MAQHARVWLVIEGKNYDPHFVDFTCMSSETLCDAGYEITQVSHISDLRAEGAGGKSACISLFSYYRKRKKLRLENGNSENVIVFVVDRDGDHICGGQLRSPHMVYTVHADTESHLFHDAHESLALAAACSLDQRSADTLAARIGDWRSDFADAWRAWISLCYLSGALKSRCWVGFGASRSRVHDGEGIGRLNEDKLREAEAAVISRSQLPSATVSIICDRTRRRIDARYDTGRQSSLVKGKWFPMALLEVIERTMNGTVPPTPWNQAGFLESVTRCYAANLNPNSPGIVELGNRICGALSSPPRELRADTN